MSALKELDRKTVKQISAEIDKALHPIIVKYGLHAGFTNASFNKVESIFKVKMEVIETKDGKTPAQLDWELNAEWIGMKSEDFGTTIEHPRLGTVKIVGHHRGKYPVVVETGTSKRYRITVQETGKVEKPKFDPKGWVCHKCQVGNMVHHPNLDRRLGPELIAQHYECFNCKHVEKEPLD